MANKAFVQDGEGRMAFVEEDGQGGVAMEKVAAVLGRRFTGGDGFKLALVVVAGILAVVLAVWITSAVVQGSGPALASAPQVVVNNYPAAVAPAAPVAPVIYTIPGLERGEKGDKGDRGSRGPRGQIGPAAAAPAATVTAAVPAPVSEFHACVVPPGEVCPAPVPVVAPPAPAPAPVPAAAVVAPPPLNPPAIKTK